MSGYSKAVEEAREEFHRECRKAVSRARRRKLALWFMVVYGSFFAGVMLGLTATCGAP